MEALAWAAGTVAFMAMAIVLIAVLVSKSK
jgi:hypothetical protein